MTSPPRARSRLRCRVALAIAPLVLVAALLAPEAAAGRAAPALSAPIAWTDCGARLQCARVPVPLDWRRPRGRRIELAVIRHMAGDPERRIGTLFLNPGGPGDSGVAAVTERGSRLDAQTRGRFDVVGWDPRGSGGSAPVNCFRRPVDRARFWKEAPVPTTVPQERSYLAKSVSLAKRCGERSGSLLKHISTTDTARDLDHLRRLVGDKQLTFVGQSTGTFLGLTYAGLFERRVRAMVLDGVEDPVRFTAGPAEALTQSLPDADRLLERFEALCQSAGAARCALAGQGRVAARVERLLARLRKGPIPAPSAAPPGTLSYGEALMVIKLYGLADPSKWPDLARQLDAAARGDGSALKATAGLLAAEDTRRGIEQGQALFCADSVGRRRVPDWSRAVGRLEKLSPIGGRVMGWAIGAPCSAWPARSSERYLGPWNATTRNPILLVGTSFDPNTPLVNARLAERRLGNAVLLTHAGYGHLSDRDPSTCVADAVGRYLVTLGTPRRGTVCRPDRLPFDPEFGRPAP